MFLTDSSTLHIKRMAWDVVSATSIQLAHSHQSYKFHFVLLEVVPVFPVELYTPVGTSAPHSPLLTSRPSGMGERIRRVKVRKLVC